MKKYNVWDYFYSSLNEAEGDPQAQPQQPQQPPQQTPDQVAQQQQQAQPVGSEAFRKLQGQVIAGVDFTPNGTEGGSLKIKVKNSYQPFVISWVNGQVTVTDMAGRTMMISDNNPQ